LALAGLALSIALVFQQWLLARIAMFLVALLFCYLSGNPFHAFRSIVTILTITIINLLVPIGRVLLKWGPFLVTERALIEGIEKAITFETLLLISRITIRPGLKLPGKFGTIVAESFSYYQKLLDAKMPFRPDTFFGDLDNTLFSAFSDDDSVSDKATIDQKPGGNSPKWLVSLTGICIAAYIPLVATIFIRN
jgi:hypothetical protein